MTNLPQPNNVKRDVHMGAKDVQYIQKALKGLGLADRVVRMAKATLHARDGTSSSGFLLVFPHKTLFYENASIRIRKKHLRVFFKDVLSVVSVGETLTITVHGEQSKAENKQKTTLQGNAGAAIGKIVMTLICYDLADLVVFRRISHHEGSRH